MREMKYSNGGIGVGIGDAGEALWRRGRRRVKRRRRIGSGDGF